MVFNDRVTGEGGPLPAFHSGPRPDDGQPPVGAAAGTGAAPGVRPLGKVPFVDRLTSAVGMGPIPWTKISRTSAMVRESARGAGADHDGVLSPMEESGRAGVTGKAQRTLDAAVDGPVEKTMKSLRSIFGQANVVEKQLTEAENKLLRGPDGELLSRSQAKETQERIHAEIQGPNGSGPSIKHRRKERSKVRDIGLMLLDLPVFTWMMLGVLNVSIAAVMIGDPANVVKAVLAVTLGLVGTFALAYVMRTFGRRHRMFKGDSGAIEASGVVRRRILIELAVLGLVLAAAALLMAARMVDEAMRDGASPLLAYFLGALMAMLIGLSAYLNYAATFDDGSVETDRLDYLAFVQSSHDAVVRALRGNLAMLLEQAGVLMALLERQLTEARTNAIHEVTRSKADKAIRVARSYAGSKAPVPEPALDFTRLELAEKQARQHKDHLVTLGALNGINIPGVD